MACSWHVIVGRLPYLGFAAYAVTAGIAGSLFRPAFKPVTPGTRNDKFGSVPGSGGERHHEICLLLAEDPTAELCPLPCVFRATSSAFRIMTVFSWLSPSDFINCQDPLHERHRVVEHPQRTYRSQWWHEKVIHHRAASGNMYEERASRLPADACIQENRATKRRPDHRVTVL